MKLQGILKSMSISETRAGVEILEKGADRGTWASTIQAPIIEACKQLKEGDEVVIDCFKSAGKGKWANKEFLNINTIGLAIPERDVNEDVKEFQEDMPPEAFLPEEEPEPEKVVPASNAIDMVLFKDNQQGHDITLILRIEKI